MTKFIINRLVMVKILGLQLEEMLKLRHTLLLSGLIYKSIIVIGKSYYYFKNSPQDGDNPKFR